jgi:hypothetical protein
MPDSGIVQGLFDPVNKAGANGALTAEMDQYPAAAGFFDELAGLIFCLFAENDSGGSVVIEIEHNELPPFLYGRTLAVSLYLLLWMIFRSMYT